MTMTRNGNFVCYDDLDSLFCILIVENSSCTELLHIIHGVANIPHSGSCISCQKVFFCRKGCPLL